jgi:hypothetical protein
VVNILFIPLNPVRDTSGNNHFLNGSYLPYKISDTRHYKKAHEELQVMANEVPFAGGHHCNFQKIDGR